MHAAKHKMDCLLLESSKNEEVLSKALDSLDFKEFKALIVVGGVSLLGIAVFKILLSAAPAVAGHYLPARR